MRDLDQLRVLVEGTHFRWKASNKKPARSGSRWPDVDFKAEGLQTTDE